MKLHPTRVPNRRLARRVAVAGVVHPARVPLVRLGQGDYIRDYTPKVKGERK